MTRLLRIAVAVAVAGGLSGCGSSDDSSKSSSSQAVLHFSVSAVLSAADGPMATIAVQNVFDRSQVFLVDCFQKSHQLDGQDFCDELLIVPPGVYDVIVQATDPTCRPEQPWYKLVVQPNTTTEVPITLVCGDDTGGLDVIVNTEYAPSVVGISFTMDGVTANKYICQGVCATDVTAVVQVYDADSPCAELFDYTFTAVDSLGNDVTATLIAGTSTTPDTVCAYSAVIDAQAPQGDYTITFRVTDQEGHTASLTFPVHLIDCGERLYFANTATAAGVFDGFTYEDFDSAHFNIDPLLAGATFLGAPGAVFQALDPIVGGVDLGELPAYLLFFANGVDDANWQGASKGYVGDVGVDGLQADERTSGFVPYAGVMYTNDITFGPWQNIINANLAQASGVTGQGARIASLESNLVAAIQQVNALTPTPGFASRSSTSLDGLNTQNGLDEVLVINVTSGLSFSTQIDITGDPGDVFILRWDTDGDPANGYQGIANPSSGGAIVPHGGLLPSNFINVAGDINASGGGTTPPPPYPQGPRYDDGLGDLIIGGSDFSGGGFFTGYWLTTGAPTTLVPATGLYIGDTQPLSNAIFVGGWYTLSTKFSLTSGTSGVYVSPNPSTVIVPGIDLEKYVSVDGGVTWHDADLPTGPVTPAGSTVMFRFVVTNTGNATLTDVTVTDDVYGPIGSSLPTLAIGASYTFPDVSATALAGQQVDTATVTGTYLGETFTDTDPAHYYGSTAASIDLEKLVSVDGGVTWYDADSPTGPVAPVGVNPRFQFVITNTGTTTMSSITLTDDVYGDLTASLLTTTLAPGESTTVNHTGTWAAGQHTDVGTTTGVSDGTTYSDTDPANYFGALSPAIDLEKYVSVDGGTTWLDADVAPGPISPIGGADPILFKFVVTNTGNATLHDVAVVDDVFGLIGTVATMAPGDSHEFLPWTSEPRTEGHHMDTGTATAVYDSMPVSDTDPAYYFGETSVPSIDLEKLVSVDGCVTLEDADWPTGPAAPMGTNPCYRFLVTNTGTETLTGVTLTDTVFGLIALPVTTLAPGEWTSAEFTGTWAQGQNFNDATVTAVPEITGGSVTDTDPAYYWGLVAPGIDVEKYVSVDGGATWVDADLFPGPYLAPGQVPMFKYVVTNTGDVPLDLVSLTDDVYGNLASYGLLQPGESREYILTGSDPYQCL